MAKKTYQRVSSLDHHQFYKCLLIYLWFRVVFLSYNPGTKLVVLRMTLQVQHLQAVIQPCGIKLACAPTQLFLKIVAHDRALEFALSTDTALKMPHLGHK